MFTPSLLGQKNVIGVPKNPHVPSENVKASALHSEGLAQKLEHLGWLGKKDCWLPLRDPPTGTGPKQVPKKTKPVKILQKLPITIKKTKGETHTA